MGYPMTAKQRANLAQQRRVPYLIGPTRTSGLPPTSWWTSAPRDGFTALAQVERPRMAQSRLARLVDPTYAG